MCTVRIVICWLYCHLSVIYQITFLSFWQQHDCDLNLLTLLPTFLLHQATHVCGSDECLFVLCCIAVGVVNKSSSQKTSSSDSQGKNMKVNDKMAVNGLSMQQANGTLVDSESAATAGVHSILLHQNFYVVSIHIVSQFSVMADTSAF